MDGCKRINVFVGKPNVGKSNVLEALSLFSISDANFSLNDALRIEETTTAFFNGDISRMAEIRLNEKTRIRLSYFDSFLRYERQNDDANVGFDLIDTEKSNFKSDIRTFNTVSFDYFKAGTAIKDFKGVLNSPKEPLCEIRKYFFNSKVDFVKKHPFRLESPFGQNIFEVISNSNELKQSINHLFRPYDLELLFELREQKFTILKRTTEGIFSIPYKLIADTLQRLIFYKAAITSNNNTVLLLEEPESHMFPPYISKFTSDIINDVNNNQYFLATHSPYVLNDFMEHAKEDLVIYLLDYKNGETAIHRMSDDDTHDAYQFGYDFFMNMENFIPGNHEKV
jgi:AAA15 family ATPase/GTPase